MWVVDESYTDNNNSQHTGRGLALPVDARPVPFKYGDGTQPSNRRQPFDATFGLQDVPAGPNYDPETQSNSLPCQGLHKQYWAGTKQSPVLAYYCAWPTAAQRAQHRPLPRQRRERLLDHRQPAELGEDRRIGVSLRVISQNTGGNLIVDIDNAPAP